MEDFWHPHTSVASLAKRVWVHGFLAGLGVVAAAFLVWVMVRGIHAPPGSQDSTVTVSLSETQPNETSEIATVPPVTGITSPVSDQAALLKTQVAQILDGVKEANQAKNLAQLLGLYSSTFPELPQKAQKISRSWETCTYPKMGFVIDEIKPLPDSRVFARVTWNIQVEDLQTKNLREVTRTYSVWFVNESGAWRIQALKKAE
jgi:hypothetical protein